MDNIRNIERKRKIILDKMRNIRSMEKGTINKQMLKVPQKGKDEHALRGPYFVISKRENGKTKSKRLKNEKELQQAEKDVKAHKEFVKLCGEFELLTEKLGELERLEDENEQEKKRRYSKSKKTKN